MEKTNRRHIKIISLCLLFAAVILLTACANINPDDSDDAKGTMNIDFGEDGMIRNGTEYYTYQVEEGQKGILSIRISKVSGRLDIDVYRVENKDKRDYTGRDLDSASFDVIVDKPGEYKVCFTANDFVGDYGVGWRVEDRTD